LDYIFHFEIIPQHYEVFLKGALLTIKLSFTATLFGLIIGIFGAMCRAYRIKPLDWIVGVYVEVIRNTPFLIQLFFIFFGLASLKFRITAGQSALIALSANLGAYATEIIRAGIEAIEKGKIEAGLSLGLSRFQVFRYIVLFPALKIVYPALSSQFILLMLGSSIVSQISAEELTFSANFLQSRTFRSFEIYLTVTLMYLILSGLFRGIFYSIYYAVFTRKSPK
jgi:polar amino acid transport system permease protein